MEPTLQVRKHDEPLYRWVKRSLMELIGVGAWRAAQTIPSERKLADRFGVSMGTIRRALDELVDENVLVRHQGRGTFVSAHDRDRYLFRFFNLCGHDGQRTYPVVTLIEFDALRADAATARGLGIGAGAKMFRIRNVLTLRGAPAVVDDIFLAAARVAGMDRALVEGRPGSLYQLYEERFQQSVMRIEERLRAVPADTAQAQALHVAVGYPLLHIVRRAFAVDGAPVELRHSYVLTDRHEYCRSQADRAGPTGGRH